MILDIIVPVSTHIWNKEVELEAEIIKLPCFAKCIK
jgi:hypothetical protein